MRTFEVKRKTNETEIYGYVNLDGQGTASIETRIGFFDHMLEQFAKHSSVDITLKAKGDLHVDVHHTVEDCGYVLGEAIRKSLGDKRGINRYGVAHVPMDDALSRSVVDFCGRPYLIWNVNLRREKIGTMDTEVFREFFLAFSVSAKANFHIESLYGINGHHIIESCFKATARSLRKAVAIDTRRVDVLPTTKGRL